MTMHDRKRFWDPLYGRTELSPFEYAIICTPEVQRLRYIRMCNINSMLVTGASEISRFEHSLGVLRLTQEWIDTHSSKIRNSDAVAFRAAALLHDMQTGPFGHSFQYILEDNKVLGDFAHDDISHGKEATYYQDLLANASFAGKPFNSRVLLGHHWPTVASMIRGEGPYGPLISGSIDLDNIDNVIRLAYHVGIASSNDSTVAVGIAKALQPKDGDICVNSAAVTLIERWQEIRHHLYEFLLLDWAEFSAKAMLTHAMELAVEYGLVGSDSWILTDDELLFSLERRGIGDAQDVANIVKRLRRGELYCPVGLFQTRKTSAYVANNKIENKRDLERQLAKFAREELKLHTNILVHYILDKKKTDRAVEIIIAESDERKIIGNNSDVLLIGVFSSTEPPNEYVGEKIAGKAMHLLKKSGLPDLKPLPDPLGNSVLRPAIEQLSLL